MAWTKSRTEILREFEEQMSAFQSSSAAFDAGQTWEAKRLATVVNILVHDHGRTISLLKQLRVKDAIRFRSSGHPLRDGNLLSEMPLVKIEMSSTGVRYLPLLGDRPPTSPRWFPFSKWWEEPILRHGKRVSVSRKNLVMAMRNQDGGGHVDP